MIINDKIPKYLNAAVLVAKKKPLKFMNLKIPKLQRGQVLVKIFYSGICGSQIMEINGHRGKDPYIPHLLGHEGYGVVIKNGSGVKKVKPNDRVILTWIKGSGISSSGPLFKFKNKTINAGPITTFSDYSIISEDRLVLAPKKITPLEAVLFGCAIPTGAGMVFNELNITKQSIVAIFGVGGVGLFSLIASKIAKAKKIIAIDINSEKLKLAKKFGATYTINLNKNNLYNRIKKITNNQLVDFSIDCAGKVETIEQSLKIINNSGTVLFSSHPKYNQKLKIDPFDLIKGKKIFGTWGGNVNPDYDIKKIYSIFKKINLQFNFFTSDIYNFKDINLAIDDYKKGKVQRPIISF